MRKKVARGLRKWADLIDPRIAPGGAASQFVVQVTCDPSDFEAGMARVRSTLDDVNERLRQLKEWIH